MTKQWIGVDAGASSTKWAIIDESGDLVLEGKSGPVDGHIYKPESASRMESFLHELKGKCSGSVGGIYAGITGASDNQEENQLIKEMIFKYFPNAQISVEIDVALGYRANFNQDRGIYLYAGTGSIAIYVNHDGKLRANGGWGYLLGDEGAGYWIGREALRQVLCEIESGQDDSRIKEILDSKLANFNRSEILKFAYGNSREDIARLAKPLIELAVAGDQFAQEIVKSAAEYLANLVLRTEDNAGLNKARVVFGGGIAQAGAIVTSELERLLGRGIEVSKENLSVDAAKLALLNFRTTS